MRNVGAEQHEKKCNLLVFEPSSNGIKPDVNGHCDGEENAADIISGDHGFEVEVEVSPLISLSEEEVFETGPDEGKEEADSFFTIDLFGLDVENDTHEDLD